VVDKFVKKNILIAVSGFFWKIKKFCGAKKSKSKGMLIITELKTLLFISEVKHKS